MSAQTVDFVSNLSFGGAELTALTSILIGACKPACGRRFNWLVCVFTGAVEWILCVVVGIARDAKGVGEADGWKRLPCTLLGATGWGSCIGIKVAAPICEPNKLCTSLLRWVVGTWGVKVAELAKETCWPLDTPLLAMPSNEPSKSKLVVVSNLYAVGVRVSATPIEIEELKDGPGAKLCCWLAILSWVALKGASPKGSSPDCSKKTDPFTQETKKRSRRPPQKNYEIYSNSG